MATSETKILDVDDMPRGRGTGGLAPSSDSASGETEDEPPDEEAQLLEEGTKVGRFLVLQRLGAGAMGVVYAAYDPKLDRKIALKLIRSHRGRDPAKGQARMEREAQAMAKLSHPNVSSIFDVGVHDDQIVLAMEYLGGGTLREWVRAQRQAQERGWREILTTFIEVGKGLAAAHSEGLIHRDFKPDNVLLDKNGVPKVVDFGLVRLATAPAGRATADAGSASSAVEAADDSGGDLSGEVQPSATAPEHVTVQAVALTRTGAIAGTPAYMAPEQFFGQAVDARTDQFAFCVALYEALYGERPFEGGDVLRLAVSVSEGALRPLPKDSGVPTWILRVILRGLSANPAERWPSMAELLGALDDDPAVRRRRQVVAVAGVTLVLASFLAAVAVVRHRRLDLERRLAVHLDEAAQAIATGRARAKGLRVLRERAYSAFDATDREQGEVLWREALARIPAVEGAYDRAVGAYEAALVLDPARSAVRGPLADLLAESLLLAEELKRGDRVIAFGVQLGRHDVDGSRRRALAAPGGLVVRTTSLDVEVTLERFERDPTTLRRTPRPAGGAAPGAEVPLPPGSYRLLARAAGRAPVLYPFEIRRGARLVLDLLLPPTAAVPSGFAYVPAGEFWYGDGDEKLRTEFLDTSPVHKRRTGPYLIALNETTYRDWIAFLEALPPGERARRAPDVSSALRGSLRLLQDGGSWQLAFQPTGVRYSASAGEPFVYVGRKRRVRQDWLDFPVAGISPADVEGYLGWLRRTGRVPGARFCTEIEWERAARGADERAFPHGDELGPDDANFDVTYGRIDTAFGPDTVGSHAASRSPHGIDDMSGNVLELVRSAESATGFVIRGGAYIFGAATCRITNRNVVPSTFRDLTTGMRVCASIEGSDDANRD